MNSQTATPTPPLAAGILLAGEDQIVTAAPDGTLRPESREIPLFVRLIERLKAEARHDREAGMVPQTGDWGEAECDQVAKANHDECGALIGELEKLVPIMRDAAQTLVSHAEELHGKYCDQETDVWQASNEGSASREEYNECMYHAHVFNEVLPNADTPLLIDVTVELPRELDAAWTEHARTLGVNPAQLLSVLTTVAAGSVEGARQAYAHWPDIEKLLAAVDGMQGVLLQKGVPRA